MNIGDLTLALGLQVDDKEWNLGEAVLKRMTAQMRELAVNAVLAKTDVKKAMDTIGISAPSKKAGETLKGIVSHGDKVVDTFKRMVVAAASFFAVSKVGGMVKDVVDLGGKLNDTAQKTGLSAERLQELGYAATLNSSSMEEVADATEKFAHRLEDVKKGQGPVVDALKKLGIGMDDPAVKAKDLDALLNMVSNKFSAMPDGAEKTAVAMDLFGKSGANLIPTLNSGVAGLAAYSREARAMGYVMSNGTVAKLDDLGDNIDRAKMALVGLRNQGVAALLPLLTEMLQKFTDWVSNNQELIRSTITSVVEALAEAIHILGEAVAFAVEHWRVLAAILAAGAIVSGIIQVIKVVQWLQAAQTIAAAKAVWAWAMILGPILLVAAAVLALGYLIYKFRDKIKAAFAAAWRWIAEKFGTTVDELKAGLSELGQDIEAIADAIISAFKRAFEWITDNAKKIPDLPVIKQLGDAGRFLSDTLAGDRKDYVMKKTNYENARDAGSLEKNEDGSDESQAQFEQRLSTNKAKQAIARQKAAAVGPAAPTLGMQGAVGAAAGGAAPSADATAAGGVVQTNQYSIAIDASKLNQEQATNMIKDALSSHDETSRRQLASSLGTK